MSSLFISTGGRSNTLVFIWLMKLSLYYFACLKSEIIFWQIILCICVLCMQKSQKLFKIYIYITVFY